MSDFTILSTGVTYHFTSQAWDSTDQHGFMDQTIPQAMGWTISFFKFAQTMAEIYGNFPKIVTIPNRGL
jgi:hypothetical protein